MDYNLDGLDRFKQSMYEMAQAIKKATIDLDASLRETLLELANSINLVGRWYRTNEILVDNQYVFTSQISSEFIEIILNTNDVDKEVEAYYSKENCKHLHDLIARCKESLKDSNNCELFNQSMKAFENKSYQLSCLGLFAITDGLLSTVSNQVNPSFTRRLNTIKKRFDETAAFEPIDQQILSISIALKKMEQSIFSDHDFHEPELECVNRHWTLHGRSERQYLFTDVIKVLLWIDALLFILKYDQDHST